MKTVDVYTDGACSGNPGVGGYCAILIYNNSEKVVSGSEDQTTNNRMELLAAIKGLETLNQACKVNLYSDSRYVVDAFNEHWISSWVANGWRTASKKEVKNVDLWLRLVKLSEFHDVMFIKVKGHSDNQYNNRCDQIAVEEYKKIQNKQ